MANFLWGVLAGLLISIFIIFIFVVIRSVPKDGDLYKFVCQDPECDFECASNSPGVLMGVASDHVENYHDNQEHSNGF